MHITMVNYKNNLYKKLQCFSSKYLKMTHVEAYSLWCHDIFCCCNWKCFVTIFDKRPAHVHDYYVSVNEGTIWCCWPSGRVSGRVFLSSFFSYPVCMPAIPIDGKGNKKGIFCDINICRFCIGIAHSIWLWSFVGWRSHPTPLAFWNGNMDREG